MGIQNSEIQNYNKIQKLIDNSRINEAFLLLKNQMTQMPSLFKETEKLKQSENTYKYMLDYISDGNNDPSRLEMVEQIREVLTHSNDSLLREIKLKESSDLYSSTKRMFNLKDTTFQKILEEYNSIVEDTFKNNLSESNRILTASQSRIINELFNYVWTIYNASSEEYNSISGLLESSDYPEYLKALIISAITLGNISYFNPETFEILLNQFESTDSLTIKARSIIGIILISLLHSRRIVNNIKIRSRLLLSFNDEDIKKINNDVFFNIIRTYDTNRVDNKMRKEVIPGLMKINPEIIDRIRNMSSDSENFLSDANPQWEDLLENSEIGNKLKEINDLQLEGADVMVTAFSNLKGFPFFSQVSNWFLPFVKGNYEFAALPLGIDEEIVKHFTYVMCDSDLHSFLLSLSTMPEDKRNLMFANMQNQMKEAYSAMSNSLEESESLVLLRKIRHSLQDLYRFFKFSRKKEEFKDPFGRAFLASDIESLMNILGFDLPTINLVAEFYFKNKYYEEASGFYELIDKLDSGDVNIWEKIGFSYDRMHQYDRALEWYTKSEIINPENPWLIKKMALALKNGGKFKEAQSYYNKALQNEPENYHLIMSAGQCFLVAEEYTQALNHFYHAQYLRPEKKDPIRAIAWTELISGNYEKSLSQYEKIINESDSDRYDFLNTAHGYLAIGNFKNAITLYKKFIEMTPNKDITSLVVAFRDDSDSLKKLGIKTSDLRLIIDKIRYDLFG